MVPEKGRKTVVVVVIYVIKKRLCETCVYVTAPKTLLITELL